MPKSLLRIIALAAILAPALHLLSDVMEWRNGGFSQLQLLINYAGFLPMPFVILGLYAVQVPRISGAGLIGALLYAVAFIYFGYTTLYALKQSIPDYETLWQSLGWVYTLHGGLMIIGGALFGFAARAAQVLPRNAVLLFLCGILINLVVGILPVADSLQIAGSTIRNLGLIGMGIGILVAP